MDLNENLKFRESRTDELAEATTGRATTARDGHSKFRKSWHRRVTAPGDRGHNRNIIILADRSRFFLQVTNVFVIQVNIYEGAQFAVIRVEVTAQVRMLDNKSVQRLTYRGRLYRYSILLICVLPKRSWDVYFHLHTTHSNKDAPVGAADSSTCALNHRGGVHVFVFRITISVSHASAGEVEQGALGSIPALA